MEQNRNETTQERAPLLRVFGCLAPRVAALIRARPVLADRLIFAPRAAVHSIGAFLHSAADAARPDAEVAATIDDSDPRDLLRAALPNCPPRLYRALDRTGDTVRERAYYEKLGEVARGPSGGALLDGEARLDDHRLDYFRALSAMDPLVASTRRALPDGMNFLEALDTAIAFLKAHGALRAGDLDLPSAAGATAVAKRLRRALGRIPAPDWQATRHHLGLIDGTEAFLASDDPPVLVGLRRAAPGVWVVEQMAGPRNGPAPEGARDALLRNLAAAGVRVVATDTATALSRLDHERALARHRRLHCDGEGAREDDDDDEEAQRDAA